MLPHMNERQPRGRISPQDLAASLVSVLLAIGVVLLAFAGKEVPAELGMALGSAITWLFVRSAQRAEHTQARYLARNGRQIDPPEDYGRDPTAPIV
jgi:hypothetical protein